MSDIALGAPNLWGQVYIAARLNQWPADAAIEAANSAIAECGTDRCESDSDLASVLREFLRTS